ncbi:hypothetical protein WA1_26060 [Scytonema hofmannii PCC 7110]|uniref:histidine kinase n=1 Tax=Scytonema hofmannii PCC 7110 TaxID=128403 RepID=A0A139X7E9_9CYAN|nr:sensor histidine kinase [Scytonema hofmannii]KYC40585.1 hypothetical protein WA1_26060 [Scytonema hofmannii PCC 7110]
MRLRVPYTLKNNLFAPLYISFFVLVLLVVGEQGVDFWIESLTQKAVGVITHSLVVEREGERLLNAVIQEERASLKTSTKEALAFHRSFNRLYNLVQDNPAQLKQLDQIKYFYDRWKSQLAHKAFPVSTNTKGYSSIENPLFNTLYAQILSLLESEQILLSKRKYQAQQIHEINFSVKLFSLMAILAGVFWNLNLLHRRVKVPLNQLIKVGEIWRAGQMEARLGYSSSDEIGHLAGVLNQMAGEACYRQQRIEVRNEQLEDLISALSHDLRTPLLATRATLESMLKGAFGSVNDTWKEIFEEYHQTNEDLLKLIETLLDVSRYETTRGANLSHDPLNWKRIFVKVITQIKATSKSEFALIDKIGQSLPTVYGDEVEIRRVVQNLLENAIRASEPNNEIVLEVEPLGEAQVKVSVRDRGLGIAQQEKERLFHRFTQGRGRCGQAGLGLYLCRQIIQAHGGSIGVESTLGKGSTFWFTLCVPTSKTEFENNWK